MSIIRRLVLTAALCAMPAFADNVITVSGTAANGAYFAPFEASYVSWTQNATYTNVAIQFLAIDTCGTASDSATVYLTKNSIGPGTTAPANEVAHNTVTFGTADGILPFTVLSGLTLGPGTYYLTFTEGVNECGHLIAAVASPSVTGAAGVTAGPFGGTGTIAAYPPASSFSALSLTTPFSVTGTSNSAPASVPALSPWALVGTTAAMLLSAMLLLGFRRRNSGRL